jgi:hypothetical protein
MDEDPRSCMGIANQGLPWVGGKGVGLYAFHPEGAVTVTACSLGGNFACHYVSNGSLISGHTVCSNNYKARTNSGNSCLQSKLF